MPYRDDHIGEERKVAEPGIVADMVRQFADKHAFLRELVQNGIDAGATRIDVRIDRDERGVTRTSVTDDGSGMTRAIVEGPLLTLFSSSKENERGKIGKYGIGFISVFALEPEHVEVRTGTGTQGWLVRLFGDHTWELAEDTAAAKGTTVTLVQPMTLEAFEAHVEASTVALRRWCRHANVPIDLVVLDAGDPAATRTIAVQEPFAVAGLATAAWEEDGERIVVGVGGPEIATGGFFNRGLTLHEARPPQPLHGIRFKIDSPRLSHTLSRDDVVRDRELRRLLRRVEELARGPLAEALHARAAEVAATATSSAAYVPYVEAAVNAAFVKKRAKLVVPLTDPVAGASTMRLAALVAASEDRVLVAAGSTAMTRALARMGRPVVRWVEVAPPLRFLVDPDVEDVAYAFAYAAPAAEQHPEDGPLETHVLAVLRALDLDAASVRLATFEGALHAQPMRVVAAMPHHESVLPWAKVEKRAWGKKATVLLNVADATVRLARRRAKTEPAVAAHLLCRALLVANGPLSAKVVDRLLEAALE